MNELMRIKTFIIGKDRKQILFNKNSSLGNIKLNSCIITGLEQEKKDSWFAILRNYRLKIKLGIGEEKPDVNTIGLETLLTPRQAHPIFPINQVFMFVGTESRAYDSIEFSIETEDGKNPELNFEFTHTKSGMEEQPNHFAVGFGFAPHEIL